MKKFRYLLMLCVAGVVGFSVYAMPIGLRFAMMGRAAAAFNDPVKNIGLAQVEVDCPDVTYCGTAYEPAVQSVKWGDDTLVAGTDYTLAYSGNVDAGTATITLTGTNLFNGTYITNFTIRPKPLTEGMVESIGNHSYTGKAQTPKPTVMDVERGMTLREGVEYTLSYANNTSIGEGFVTVTGKGNYTGSITRAFVIEPSEGSELEERLGGAGKVESDGNGGWIVTLTNDVDNAILPLEIPDNIGNVTIDLNGHDLVGEDGRDGARPSQDAGEDGKPAIVIVPGEGDGEPTVITIVNSGEDAIVQGGEGGAGSPAGNGAPAIEVTDGAQDGVLINIGEGVTAQGGDDDVPAIVGEVGVNEGTIIGPSRIHIPGEGTVAVPKSWKVGQKVTWKATANKGSVFARWEGPLVDSLNLTRNERRNPSLAFVVPEGFAANMVTAVFIMADDDDFHTLGITQTEFAPNETLSDVYVTDDSWSYVTAAVKGLPPGLKFDAKKSVISGKATKPGVYKVTVSATNATVKKPVTAEFEIVVPNLKSEVMSGLKPETDAYGIVLCGVNLDAGLIDCTPEDGWTGKVTGLPAGLKFTAKDVIDPKTKKVTVPANTVYGVPTKAGTFTVTFTASKKGATSQTATITLKTEALPGWAVGTFTGYVTDGGECGYATITVDANGKVSGKVLLGGTNWTFSAASYARMEKVEGIDDLEEAEAFIVEAEAKAGKVERAIELEVAACDGGFIETDLLNAVAEGSFGDGEAKLWRGMWKDKATAATSKATLAEFEGAYTLSMAASCDCGSGYLSLAVGKDGNVKATGKLADGTSVSITSPLMYDGADWFALLYAAPSAYKGGAFWMPVGLEPKGVLHTAIASPLWTSRNPQATDEYGAGFVRDLTFTGAYYDKLVKLSDSHGSLRVGLDDVPQLGYTFKETILDGNNRKKTESRAGSASAVDTLWQDGLTVTFNAKGEPAAAKATRPVQDRVTKEWAYEGSNDGGLTFSLAQATGVFKGSYTFWYDYVSAYDNTTGKETWAHTSKKVNFEGIVVQGMDSLSGFYLWDESAAYEDPQTGKEKTYKYKASKPVVLQ